MTKPVRCGGKRRHTNNDGRRRIRSGLLKLDGERLHEKYATPDCAPCETCGGAKNILTTVDGAFTTRTVVVRCPTCGGTGRKG